MLFIFVLEALAKNSEKALELLYANDLSKHRGIAAGKAEGMEERHRKGRFWNLLNSLSVFLQGFSGRDGFPGSNGIPGPPGHVFIIPVEFYFKFSFTILSHQLGFNGYE